MSADLDQAIDRAVRGLLDVEGPGGLRERVMQRIGAPVEGWLASTASSVVAADASVRWKAWLTLPIAAAAVIVLGVLVPWRTERPAVAPIVGVANDRPLAAPGAPVAGPAPEATFPKAVARARPGATRSGRRIDGAVAPADTTFSGDAIAALPGPAPLGVERLSGPEVPAVPRLGVAPIEIRALAVNAITETPRERREE